MVSFFEKCGYYVNSPNKKQNPVINIMDGGLVIAYITLSFINLSGSTPSELVFFLNVIALGRIILKNVIEQNKVAKVQSGTDTFGITLVHVIKIAVEGTLLFLLAIFYIWARIKMNSLDVVRLIVGAVLIVTLFENLWSVCERLYDATPKPLRC